MNETVLLIIIAISIVRHILRAVIIVRVTLTRKTNGDGNITSGCDITSGVKRKRNRPMNVGRNANISLNSQRTSDNMAIYKMRVGIVVLVRLRVVVIVIARSTIKSTVNLKGNSTCEMMIDCNMTITITSKSKEDRKRNRDFSPRYVLVDSLGIRLMAVYIALVMTFVVVLRPTT